MDYFTKHDNISLNIIFPIIVIILFTFSDNLFGQGQYLRGEKWQKFSAEGKIADFYVAPNGNDSWSGKISDPNNSNSDGPFKTIQRAKEAVRELKREIYTPEEVPIEINYIGSPHKYGDGDDILVLIRGGYYSLETPIKFSPEDGGERVETNMPSGAFEYHKLKDYYVTYAAFPGETPIISGGRKISSWKREKKYWVANTGNLDVSNIVIDGESQTLARTPNSGYYIFSKASTNSSEFSFNPGELKKWPEMDDNRIRMYLRWHYGVNSISSIDENNNLAKLKAPQEGILVISPRYFVENIKAILDSPGEWFYEKESGKVFIIPPDKISDPNNSRIVSPVLNNLISIEGIKDKPVRNLRFYGLTFEATTSGSSIILIKYSNKCEIVESEIRSAAGMGIHLGVGCFQTKILNNRIHQTVNSAIRAEGISYPSSWQDLMRELNISYNYIEKCGGTTVAISNALFTTISHNEISENLGRTAIYVGGWANLEEAIDGGYRVEYNHIHNAQKFADDSGVITTGGYTFDSIIRGNLIHDVKKGMFNDNVAIWFDNMSHGWRAENNIFFDLEQGEMKLCAANLVDNIYKNNYRIERPEIMPSGIIIGKPEFEYSNLFLASMDGRKKEEFQTGEFVKINAEVHNTGATGIESVNLYVNGKVMGTKNVPLIADNTVQVSFDHLISSPGLYRFSINNSEERSIIASGNAISFLYDSLNISSDIIPEGEKLNISARVKKVRETNETHEAILYFDDQPILKKLIKLNNHGDLRVNFNYLPKAGKYNVRIGNSETVELIVYPIQKIDIGNVDLNKYCTSRAEPCELSIDQQNNKFKLKTAGTDFFHGEDAYASIFLKEPIKGNFVATVKVVGFGERTHEWFRAGLFARNDMTKSFETGMGSKGSVLMFVSPRRGGMNWDEHGDGCMHKASSENLPEIETYPMWIKLVRKGNSFSGYISYDGENWLISRHTNNLPGLNESIHLGLAAGGPDQRVYSVEFADFELLVEK